MFTQIFLSEIISIAENGGQGTHFLISQILKGLTHSAVFLHSWFSTLIACLPNIISKYAIQIETTQTSMQTTTTQLTSLADPETVAAVVTSPTLRQKYV